MLSHIGDTGKGRDAFVRVSAETRRRIRDIARERGVPQGEAVEAALDAYETARGGAAWR